jgi:hypothetical protein
MVQRTTRLPPRWFFAILMVGGLVASGIYMGKMQGSGPAPADVFRAVAFGIFGLVMLWGAFARR